ncbi:MAG: fluoride efflux transporter CrcB [Fidelibacterota bacterium]
MQKFLIIGTRGFIGSVTRYLLSGSVHRILGKPYFPYGTLAVNILGCFLIGFLTGVSETRQLFNPEMRLFLFIGLLGGFTTFSTFGYEVFSFASNGELFSALVNVLIHMIFALGMV